MEKIKTVEEFCKRVKEKKCVSRFDFTLGFEWTAEASAKLRAVVADLRFANLRFADLSSADLSSANLSSADLRFADLSSADLSYADLSFADLSSANLSSAKGTFFFNFGVNLKVVEEEAKK